MRVWLVAFIFLSLGGCIEHKSENPEECYRLWSGEGPPSDIKLLHAKYWQSPHWTKEYILYMELIAPLKWRTEFIEQNHLIRDSSSWSQPSDAPNWFKPPANYIGLKLNQSEESSRYFEDTITGNFFYTRFSYEVEQCSAKYVRA
jgi:hypothetical protein